MGIHNLLPFVKNACRQGNISEFAHQSIAVDVSCLLHRGLIGCADKVAQGCETDFYIRYVLKYVRALLAIDCHVILVFDGQMLPAKKETNSSRREKRDFHKQRGHLLMSEGRASEAYDCFKRSASLTPKVIESAIQAFRHLNMVDVIVAPYESDAQLTFLTKAKMAQAVVTEDSDLIAFGCEKIIFKMDPTGSCVIFEQNLLPKCLCKALAENFDFDKFRRICILSGCDYLQAGLPGVGLNKAAAFFSKTSGRNLYQVLPRLPRYLNKNSLKVTKQFIEDFIRAENTFLHQIIFDPIEKRQRPLNEYPLSQQSSENDNEFHSSSQGSNDHFSYAGNIQPPEIAMSFALGNIPGSSQTEQITLPENVPNWSIWSSNYKSAEMRQKEKCDEEIRKKSSYGVFMLTLPEKSTEKMFGHSSESSRPPLLRISNCLSTMDSKILAKSLTNDDDDFVSSEKTKDLHEKPLTKTSKINQIFTKIGRERTSVHSIGVTRTGNGARRNWNCDRLLKEFITTTDISQKNVTKSDQFSVEVPVKKSRKAAEDDCINQDNYTGEDIIPVTSSMENPSKISRNNIFFSKYFLNKRSKTSGLSRRSASSCIVPSVSQAELSQTDSDGSQDIQEKANSDMSNELRYVAESQPSETHLSKSE
uniref:Exonuclease 1 n=1 Tax=Onchocerca volvulus TaxID=6282 RepID=A0A2K6WJ54_ONCVO